MSAFGYGLKLYVQALLMATGALPMVLAVSNVLAQIIMVNCDRLLKEQNPYTWLLCGKGGDQYAYHPTHVLLTAVLLTVLAIYLVREKMYQGERELLELKLKLIDESEKEFQKYQAQRRTEEQTQAAQ